MNKIFSGIGIITIIVAIFYFCVITPINKFSELKSKNSSLVRELNNKEEELEKTYENFYNAIRAHTDWETTKAIYEDSRYFEEDVELKNKKFKTNISEYSRY